MGKSSLVLRFVKGQFHEYQESTIGGECSLKALWEVHWVGCGFVMEFKAFILCVAAFLTQTVNLDDTTVKFEIWDTAGQERYHSLAPMYYRGAQAAIVVYDITNMVSGAAKGVGSVEVHFIWNHGAFLYVFRTHLCGQSRGSRSCRGRPVPTS